jgi:hypothetical protein
MAEIENKLESEGGHEHRLHVHYNYSGGHAFKPEQVCIATYDMRPGSQVSMHMHDGDCARCPNGHCHAPSIVVVMTKDGELMMTFENFPPPQHVEGNHSGELPSVITHQRSKSVDEETFEAEVEADLDTFQILRPAWESALDGEFAKEVVVLRSDDTINPADHISTQRATRPDVAVMKYLAEKYSLDLLKLFDRVQIISPLVKGLDEFTIYYDVSDLVAEVSSERPS